MSVGSTFHTLLEEYISELEKFTEGRLNSLDIVCNDITYWKNAYYDLIHKRGSYVSYLRELNEMQAAKIQELEMMLSFIRRVGDGVYISDHAKLMRLYRFYKDHKGLTGLKRSRYYPRSGNE